MTETPPRTRRLAWVALKTDAINEGRPYGAAGATPTVPARRAAPPVARTPPRPTLTVIVCAYTMDRWDDLTAALASVRAQDEPPTETILVADHCHELAARAAREFTGVTVLRNRGRRGLSGARNTGVEGARGDIVAFLDDDAVAEPDWTMRLLDGYADPNVLGVGGRIRPNWDTARPAWFPAEFDWVVGCTYRGMPEHAAPVRNLIGANMSFRRSVLVEIGGFRTDLGRVGTRPLGCEETELCIRAAARYRGGTLAYEPAAAVGHRVPAARTTRRYFRARCWAEGLSKAAVSRHAGTDSALASERSYLASTIPRALVRPFAPGGTQPKATVPTLVLGVLTTALGYAAGRARGLGRDPLPTPPAIAFRAFGVLALPIAALLWILAVRMPVAVDRMRGLGLLDVLPTLYWCALGLLVAGFAATLLDRTARTWRHALYTVALVTMLHATPAVLYEHLRYAWAWKHVEVVDQFLRNGRTLSDAGELTPYHEWPGFFSAAATLVRACGVPDALAIAAWSPLAFDLVLIGPLVLLYRTLTRNRRIVWAAVWIYFCTAWVGQDYFAPQTFAFVLYVSILALALDRTRRPLATLGLCTPLVLAVVTSHQLTPVMVAVAALALTCSRAHRRVALPLLALTAAAAVGWDLTVARPFVFDQLGLAVRQFGDFEANANAGMVDLGAAEPGQVLVARVDRALTAAVVVLAAAALVRRPRLRRSPATLLAIAPLPLLAAGAYGGEIIFRVYLFALPAVAFLIASWLAPLLASRGRPHPRALALPVVFALLLTGLVFGYYGKERQNHFGDAEIAARQRLAAVSGPGDLIVAATNNFPGAYAEYETQRHRWFAMETPALRERVLRDPATSLTTLADEYDGATAYLFLTAGQRAECDQTGLLPAGALDRMDRALVGARRFTLVLRDRGAVIYRIEPAR
ncbi:glycosyltransferase family 2 protein [Embleya sp. NBC_00896]|uniref:glycosyltransferase family 2 protein n=1 Tax=Embleya sp. NBC_00896 TaxID=2975961 RepID=UPI00386D6EC1|nr:glycosyltransferase [Embleya sp. NBC_00896]